MCATKPDEKPLEREDAISWAAERNSPVDPDTKFDVAGFEQDLLSKGFKVVKA